MKECDNKLWVALDIAGTGASKELAALRFVEEMVQHFPNDSIYDIRVRVPVSIECDDNLLYKVRARYSFRLRGSAEKDILIG